MAAHLLCLTSDCGVSSGSHTVGWNVGGGPQGVFAQSSFFHDHAESALLAVCPTLCGPACCLRGTTSCGGGGSHNAVATVSGQLLSLCVEERRQQRSRVLDETWSDLWFVELV